jgi:hypothetical protein
MVQELGSYVERFEDPMTLINAPKSVKEVTTEVMKVAKAVELFQTMVILSLNMGNLTLEVNISEEQIGFGGKEEGNFTGGIG